VKVTILGSGTCVPRLDRCASAVLIEIDSVKILIDLGPGTLHRLLQAGVTIFDLTHIFISHFHPDHTAELVPLIFATKYPDGSRRHGRLNVFGGTGFKQFYQGLQSAYGNWIVLPQEQLSLHEIDTLDGEVFHLDRVQITARPMNHRPESLGYRIQTPEGRSMVYSGDTDTCPALVDLAHQTDLFICESAFPDELRTTGHLTPSLAAGMAHAAQVKHLVLTHLYPPCDEVDIAKQAASVYKGPVTVARDLMTFVLE
jgi:ribonuclease BN (tRNA processing enzyme)